MASKLTNCQGVQFIPYHAYAGTKSTFIGREDNGKESWIPLREQVLTAQKILQNAGIKVFN